MNMQSAFWYAKETVFVFVEYLYDCLMIDNNKTDLGEIIWTDGHSSGFKNKFIVEIFIRLTEKYNEKFTWKFFTTSYGKGVVDAIGGNSKSIVRQKTFSKWKDRIILQNAKEFASAAACFVSSTTVV